VLTLGAMLTGSSCWKNSPQSRAAIATAIAWAQRQ
ncbi:MAG: recombinase RecA, partial [Cardiobacterium sp.]